MFAPSHGIRRVHAPGAPRDALQLWHVDHPLVQHKLALLRDRETPMALFRQTVRDLGTLMVFAAGASLPTRPRALHTPLAATTAPSVDEGAVTLVPVLRAGLPLAEAFSALLPGARVGHVGVYRDANARPVEYLARLPAPVAAEHARCWVLDPMLATGHSAEHAIDVITRRGYPIGQLALVCLLAAPEGLDVLGARFPGLPVWTAAIDERLDEHAYIVPGLGDAGDRIFGTEH
ncbi:MAG: uracil phosphoribosyltransferase [Pseudomonadota bacterium]|jgi:uracil phosphoribosyltransferase